MLWSRTSSLIKALSIKSYNNYALSINNNNSLYNQKQKKTYNIYINFFTISFQFFVYRFFFKFSFHSITYVMFLVFLVCVCLWVSHMFSYALCLSFYSTLKQNRFLQYFNFNIIQNIISQSLTFLVQITHK